MSFGEESGGGSEIDFETLQARNWPSVSQFSVFLENRVGQLLELVRAFQGSKVDGDDKPPLCNPNSSTALTTWVERPSRLR